MKESEKEELQFNPDELQQANDEFKATQSTMLRVAGFEKESVVDGPGIRYTIFVQGCLNGCKGCHNPETHSLTGGKLLDIYQILTDIKSNPLIRAVTFSGGEPFLQYKPLTNLAKLLKKNNYHLMCYTGFLYNDIVNKSMLKPLLQQLDLLVDGPFLLEKESIECKYRGSTNQRIINVQKSIEAGKVIEENL